MMKALPFLLVLFCINAFAQESIPGTVTICPGLNKDMHTIILPRYGKSDKNVFLRNSEKSNIIVSYNGFSEEAKNAFQYAVDIWKQIVPSEVPIKIRANWSELDEGVLGSAGPGTYYRNFEGAPVANVWYPVALAEKLARRELNSSSAADINANFNNAAEWYFGTDGNTPAGKTDFVTVVLHELGHGLGFTDLMGYNEESEFGNWGINTDYYSIYDKYIVNNYIEQLVDTSLFANPSIELGIELTSGKLYFNSLIAIERNEGKRPRLYSPSTWNSGSSIAHLDESTYPAGDINSLMSPRVGRAEAIHEPGPLTLAMFAEMGWFYTFVNHVSLNDTEELAGELYFNISVKSDNEILEDSVKLHIQFIDGENLTEKDVRLEKSADNPELFTGMLPYELANKTKVRYYFTVRDNEQRIFRLPVKEEEYYEFSIGPDSEAPIIVHNAVSEVYEDASELEISAVINDNLGVDTSYVEYIINNGEVEYIGIERRLLKDDRFFGTIILTDEVLKGGDSIRYRIFAADIAQNRNIQVEPTEGFFSVKVISLPEADTTYQNDFSNVVASKEDFIGEGFDIFTEVGFANNAIHTVHPYQAAGAENEINYILNLMQPIYVRDTEATLQFDEVVLVEPGEDGVQFSEEGFYDYVIVEGSRDKGATWLPLGKGYDATDDSKWLEAYNKNINEEQNSNTKGNSNLFKTRTIDLHETFDAGDVIRIRFRLYSDPAAVGWGWAIDNLVIQPELVPNSVRESDDLKSLSIYPNPSDGNFFIDLTSMRAGEEVKISVLDMSGRRLFIKEERIVDGNSHLEMDLGFMAEGNYLVELVSKDKIWVKRIVIQ